VHSSRESLKSPSARISTKARPSLTHLRGDGISVTDNMQTNSPCW
jgi:hypothetical protein